MNRHSARGNSQEGEIASSSFILVEPLGGTKNGSNTIDGSSSSSFDALALNSYREGADMTRAGCNVISHLSGSLQVNGMLMPAFQEQVAFANGGESLVETKDSDDVSKSVAIDSTDACRVSFNDDIMSAVIPTYNSTIKTCPGDAHDKKISMKTFQGSSERYVHFSPDVVERDEMFNALFQLRHDATRMDRVARTTRRSSFEVSPVLYDQPPVLPKRDIFELLPENNRSTSPPRR